MQPDDDYLARSIAGAFDRLPEPAAARLEALERRLSLQRARVGRTPQVGFWWLLAGLVATGAAAWWGGQYFGHGASRPLPASAPAAGETQSDQSRDDSERKRRGEPAQDAAPDDAADSHTIYRREVY